MNVTSIYDRNKWELIDGIFATPDENPVVTTVWDETGRTNFLVLYFHGALLCSPSSEECKVFNDIIQLGKRVLFVECYVSEQANKFDKFSILEFLGSNDEKSWFQKHLDKGLFEEYCTIFDQITGENPAESGLEGGNSSIIN